jgi:DnaJ-class molecular chaperone
MNKKKIKCPKCDGKGYVTRPTRVSCPQCGGTKWIYIKENK